MRALPTAEPGTPQSATPWRYLGWLVGRQKPGIALGVRPPGNPQELWMDLCIVQWKGTVHRG